MKTIRFMAVLAGIGTWIIGPCYGEPSAPAPRTGSAPVEAGQKPHVDHLEEKTEGHIPKKKEENHNEERKASTQTSTKSEAAGKNEVKANVPSSFSPRALSAHRHEMVQRQVKQARENHVHYAEKTAANRQTKTGAANAGGPHATVQAKSTGAGADGKSAVNKTVVHATRLTTVSVPSLPTSAAAKTAKGRSPGLATIGGPAKTTASHNTALSGSSVKLRP